MSFQAVSWAIEQKAGGPSGKATLWSIANYANEQWCAWPSQKTICEESEQSPDAIQKRLPELETRGLIRRLPLRFAGRRTVDFFVLKPSPFFESTLAELEPLLPRGCSIDINVAAARAGSGNCATHEENEAKSLPNSEQVVFVPQPQEAVATLLSQPQLAAHATAYERQQEPVIEPKKQEIDKRARESLISKDAQKLADDCIIALGLEPEHPPVELAGLPYQTSIMLARGYDPLRVVAAFARFAGQQPIKPLTYFIKAVETACTAPPLVAPSERSNGRQGNESVRTGFVGPISRGAGRDYSSRQELRSRQAEANVAEIIRKRFGVSQENGTGTCDEIGKPDARRRAISDGT